MQQLQTAWKQLEGSVSNGQNVSALTLCAYLLLGGVLALYCRFLYRRCGASPSDSDSITRIFPLLTLVTTAVIAVVKSSLALSLGLVGALSIVRFRSAIKEPEELVYLFLCIAIGLALGAEQPLLAITLVLVASVFIFGMHLSGSSRRQQNLLLTITGDSQRHFGDGENDVLSKVEAVAGRYMLQRLDLSEGRSQVRVVLGRRSSKETADLLKKLRVELPDCEMSYVNINSTL
ncbi:MAG: DUF4956 domain-containing protein [Pirellulaceae bacterium]